MNGARECSRATLAKHLVFSRRQRRQRWESGLFDHFVDARDGASADSASVGGRTWSAFCVAARFAFAGGANAQPVELGFQRRRLSVAIRLIVFEHVPGDGDQLARAGDYGHVAIFLFRQLAKEHTQRAGMKGQRLRPLHQHPAGMAAALFGDGSVIAVRGGLAGGRNESEISRGFVGGGKAGDIAQHGEQRLRDREIDAGQSHQQLDARIVVGLLSQCAGEIEDLLFDVTDLPKIAIQRLAAQRIDVELAKPGQRLRAEEIVVRSLDQALMQDGMDAILDAGAVGHQRGALGGLMAKRDGGWIGDPHARQEIAAQQVGQHQRVDLIGFDFGFGDGAGAQRVGDHHFGNKGLQQADHGPGVGGGFNGNVGAGRQMLAGEAGDGFPGGGEVVAMEHASGVVEDYGFDDFLVQIERGKWHNKFTPVCGERAGSFSVQRERPPETRLPVTRFWMDRVGGRRRQGQNGTYLFELEVQPGGPEGRPDTTAGSQPIRIIGRPQGVRPCSPWMVGCSSHLVPSPVSNSRSQLARGWQVPAGRLLCGVAAMPLSNHARYDGFGNLYQKNTNSNSSTTWGQGFVYDGFGNLYQKNVTQGSAPSLSVTSNAATNQISGYGYDSNGNTTYMPGSSPLYMSYDVENRMASATQNSTPQVLYAYDASNRRVWKGTVNNSGVITAQEMYYYGADGKKLGTYVAQFGSPGQWFATDLQVHFGGRRVAHWAGSVINSQVILVSTTLDRVGSVRNAGSNGTGSGFYPYGEDKGTAAPNDQTKFATYTRDSATGLDYAMNRYYSNTLGRFMSADVAVSGGGGHLQNPGSFNQYAYAGGEPLSRVDPGGNDWLEDPIGDFNW